MNFPVPSRTALCLVLLAAFALCGPEDIVINEIHYHPSHVCEKEEFFELYNRGAEAVNMGGWYFREGVVYEFPPFGAPPLYHWELP